MALNKTTFLKGLKYINDYYTNFNFDIENTGKINIWYSVFKNFDDNSFVELVQDYCRNNIYAPTSPTSILQHKTNQLMLTIESGEEVFEKVLEEIRRKRWFLKEVSFKNEVINKTYNDCFSDFVALRDDEGQLVYTKKTFINAYNKNIQKHQQEISKNVLLGNIDIMMIGE